ncbi:MAG: DUF1614 domain-containing protein [Gammaproteobacteria bacterium]|nr:DUF1614 domain-containing protein [Gammaproteobacteria bacterium]
MRHPFHGLQWLLLLIALGIVLLAMQLQVVNLTADKVGLSATGMISLLFLSLCSSGIHLPLCKLKSSFDPQQFPDLWRFGPATQNFSHGQTRLMINVGGGVVPVSFCIFLQLQHPLPLPTLTLAIASTTAICYFYSRPIAGMGIGMPLFIAPISAALVAILLSTEQRAALAYISGSLGVLLGADLLRLADIRQLAVPQAAIGGAGTFDGIFITGLIAVLLT